MLPLCALKKDAKTVGTKPYAGARSFGLSSGGLEPSGAPHAPQFLLGTPAQACPSHRAGYAWQPQEQRSARCILKATSLEVRLKGWAGSAYGDDALPQEHVQLSSAKHDGRGKRVARALKRGRHRTCRLSDSFLAQSVKLTIAASCSQIKR